MVIFEGMYRLGLGLCFYWVWMMIYVNGILTRCNFFQIVRVEHGKKDLNRYNMYGKVRLGDRGRSKGVSSFLQKVIENNLFGDIVIG